MVRARMIRGRLSASIEFRNFELAAARGSSAAAAELFADDLMESPAGRIRFVLEPRSSVAQIQTSSSQMSRRASRDARITPMLLLCILWCALSAAALSVDASPFASASGGADSCDLGSHTVALDTATRALTVTRIAHSSSVLSASASASAKQLVFSASAPFVRAQSAPQRVRQWSGDFVIDNAAPALASDEQTVDAFACAVNATTGATTATITGRLVFGSLARTATYSLAFAESAAATGTGSTSTGSNGGGGTVHFELDIDSGDAQPALNQAQLVFDSAVDEHVYGFGNQYSFTDLRGQVINAWISEQGVGRGLQPVTFLLNTFNNHSGETPVASYAALPFFVTSQNRALLLDGSEYATFDLASAAPALFSVTQWSLRVHGRLMSADSMLHLLTVTTGAMGRMAPLPEWISRGAVVGTQGGEVFVQEKLDALLSAHPDAPVAALWLQDWVGTQKVPWGEGMIWNWEPNAAQYANWSGFIQRLAARDIRMMVYLNPLLRNVSSIPGLAHYYFDDAMRLGYFVRSADGSVFLSYAGAGLIDLTNPAARDWLKGLIVRNVLAYGVSGWMADFGESMPIDAQLFDGSPAASMHNRFPLLWQQLNAEAVAEAGRSGDVVFFCRSAYVGSAPLTPLFWLGDQLTSWDAFDGIQTAVLGMLHAGVSGLTLTHSDLGGYTSVNEVIAGYPLLAINRSKELLLRWCELSAFTAAYRTHAGNLPSLNAQFWTDADTLAQFSRFATVYAAWHDLRQELMTDVVERGWPLVRPLFLHFGADAATWTIGLQYLIGEEMMVAPVVTQGAVSVRVYFPVGAGPWTAVFDPAKTVYATPGWVEVDAPIGRPAVFVRTGSATGARFVRTLRERGVID